MKFVFHAVTLTAVLLNCVAFAQAGSSNSLLDISADGALLASANRDNGTVSIVDIASGKVLREVPVGNKTEGVSFVGQSHTAAATAYADDQITIFDADTGDILKTIPVFDEPYGIISARDGSKLYATLEY